MVYSVCSKDILCINAFIYDKFESSWEKRRRKYNIGRIGGMKVCILFTVLLATVELNRQGRMEETNLSVFTVFIGLI